VFVCSWKGRLVAHCTLRLLNPECHLSSDWTEESLPLQSSRAVSLLYANSISSSSSSIQHPPQPESVDLLPAPTVAYCFPLLRAVVASRKNLEQDEALTVQCLDLLSTHTARLRSEDHSSEVFSLSVSLSFCLCCLVTFSVL